MQLKRSKPFRLYLMEKNSWRKEGEDGTMIGNPPIPYLVYFFYETYIQHVSVSNLI